MAGPSGITRKEFLQIAAVAGGGLVAAFCLPMAFAPRVLAAAPADAKSLRPNAFVRITPDDWVTVTVGHTELGQGTLTAMSMIVAEELDADWSRVRWEEAPTDHAYDQPVFRTQITAGSMSTPSRYMQQRRAGAAVRAMLVAAAANRWGADAASLRTESGRVIDPSTGRSATYGELASEAAGLPVPEMATLKDPKDFRIIGKPLRRVDAPEKVTGAARYGLDVRLPDMLTAVRLRPPVFGGKARSFDAARAKAVPGVVAVFEIPTGIAVVAQDFWSAKKARDALVVDWDPGAGERITSPDQRAAYIKLMDTPGATVIRNDGDVAAAEQGAKRRLAADFRFPYLAHVPMEPENCVVDLRDDGCEIWIGTQWQSSDQMSAARITGLKPEQVKLNTMFAGGGFGRRSHPVVVAEAMEVAKAARLNGIRAPVKLVWTREDDVKGGVYRPFVHARLTATLDEAGRVTSWTDRHATQSIVVGTVLEAAVFKNGIDTQNIEGAADMPYAVPSVRFDIHQPTNAVPAWFWRSVGHSYNAFIVETFIDELSHAAGKDPYEFRRGLLLGKPRHLGVLDAAAKASGWAGKPPKGMHRGIAVHESYGSFVAQVIEVSVTSKKALAIHRVVMALDCGTVINPNLVEAQMQSAIIFGLSGALFQEITLKDGVVEQGNFNDYPVVRMHQVPKIEVHIVESHERPTGCGEPGTECVAPALANAIFAATGERIRSLPLKHAVQVA